jgi:hypothetical protein
MRLKTRDIQCRIMLNDALFEEYYPQMGRAGFCQAKFIAKAG